jgi:hypothetical protein
MKTKHYNCSPEQMKWTDIEIKTSLGEWLLRIFVLCLMVGLPLLLYILLGGKFIWQM